MRTLLDNVVLQVLGIWLLAAFTVTSAVWMLASRGW